MNNPLKRYGLLRLLISALSLAMIGWAVMQLLLPNTAPGGIKYRVTNTGLPLIHTEYIVQAFEPGGGRLVASSNGNGEHLSVPPGQYDIRASITASFPPQVDLRPRQNVRGGRDLNLAFDFSYGELDVRPEITTAENNAEIVIVQVFPVAERTAYVTAFDAGNVTKLAAANYDIRVVLTVNSREEIVRWYESITIEPGRQFRLVSAFEQGFIRIEAHDSGQPIGPSAATVYAFHAGDPLLKVVNSGSIGIPLRLPVGSYDLKVAYGAANDRPTQKINALAVTDRQTNVVQVQFQTGTVLLRARAGDDPLDDYAAYA